MDKNNNLSKSYNINCTYCFEENDMDYDTNEKEQNINDFGNNLNKIAKIPRSMERPIDIIKMKTDLYKAMIFPENFRHIRFPAPFNIPTYTYQQKSTFTISLNANGCGWVEVNMGQFCDPSRYYVGGYSNAPTNTIGNTNDGNLTLPISNIFYNTGAQLDGINALYFQANAVGNANISGSNISTSVPTGTFNAVRCGPMSVKYEYVGRLDASQGKVSLGLNYTNVSIQKTPTPTGTQQSINPIIVNDNTIALGLAAPGLAGSFSGTFDNGLLPDLNYTTIQTIEDCPFARVGRITDSFKAIFVPQDYSILNLKSTTDSAQSLIAQRLFILVSNGPPSATGAVRITVTANWEGVPSKTSADWVTCDYTTYPPGFDAQDIFTYMVKNNLVITQDDDEFGINKFAEALRAYL